MPCRMRRNKGRVGPFEEVHSIVRKIKNAVYEYSGVVNEYTIVFLILQCDTKTGVGGDGKRLRVKGRKTERQRGGPT